MSTPLTADLLMLVHQLEARCRARGQDLVFSPTQASTLQGIQHALATLDAQVVMNAAILALLRERQAELETALAAHPAGVFEPPWTRYRAAFRAFEQRLDATRAASNALTTRQLTFIEDVLSQPEQEGTR